MNQFSKKTKETNRYIALKVGRWVGYAAIKCVVLICVAALKCYNLGCGSNSKAFRIEPEIDDKGDVTYDGSGIPLNKK